MKTVPSLVASSTVGAAATGFTFANYQDPSQSRPTSNKRKATEYEDHTHRFSVPPLRPKTTSAIVTPNHFYPGSAHGFSPWPSLEERRPTSRKEGQKELGSGAVDDQTVPCSSRDASGLSGPSQLSHESRDPISKRDSWYKRFSARPISQAGTGSPRSSVGPDSPSGTFSQVSSAAPILSSGGNPSQLPPNKLVKPAPVQRDGDITPLSRNTSRSHVPTLRRPATSHQRSATLKQRFKEDELAAMRRPITQHNTSASNHTTPPPLSIQPQTLTRLRLHFDARPTRTTKERTLSRKAGTLSRSPAIGNKRILPDSTKRPILVKPAMLSDDVIETTVEYFFDDKDSSYVDTPDYTETVMYGSFPGTLTSEDNDEVDEEGLQKHPRRSLSMQFSSPTTWIKRSSSLRSNKCSKMVMDADKRYSSAPVASNSEPAEDGETSASFISTEGKPNRTTLLGRRVSVDRGDRTHRLALTGSRTRSRNNSSPLPLLAQFSSPNIDLTSNRFPMASPWAMPSSPLSPVQSEAAPSASGPAQTTFAPVSSPRISSNGSKFTGVPSEHGSTLIGSDNDTRAFWSGEEDDFDFQSDTVFDSVRTGATGNGQRNALLDTLFDETPVASPKTKIAPLHELMALGAFRETGDRIIEEDEDMLTPVKNGLKSRHTSPNNINAEVFPSSSAFELPSSDFGRLSLDDEDEDEDWTKDEDDAAINSPLSPASSSLNSSRVSPALRIALADLTNGVSSDRRIPLSPLRTKQSVFDWSEPSPTDKLVDGNSARPKTAHARQLADVRGGRAIGRRGPSTLHIRSQSVPVVPDLTSQRETTNTGTKFGTWGLGAKGVSEDWDNDFEFDSMDIDEGDEGNTRPGSMVMQVPPAIQASQANVVGHVSQIREICHLVADLKRLRNLAREKGLLYGPTAALWAEAEGIIALAIPDEDDDTLSSAGSPVSTRFRRDSLDPKFTDWGVAAEDVSLSEHTIEVLDSKGRPTGKVYDGKVVRRGSVFSPEDDIFGNSPITDRRGSRHGSQTPTSTTFPRTNSRDSAAIARAVMEMMHQHRTTSDSPLANSSSETTAKMPFDTTSLKDLVGRAGALSRSLAEIVRKHDDITSPCSPSSRRDMRPAFTRVFTDPLTSSPPRNLPRSQSNSSILSSSLDSSPSRSLGQRMHMMTVV